MKHWRESVAWQQDFVMPVSQIVNPSVPSLPHPLGWPAAPTRASCEITECAAEGGPRDGQSLIIEPSSWEYLVLAPSSQPEREVCSSPQREQRPYRNLCPSQEQPNSGNMFAVHLMAFYFTKLKEDQIKKVRTAVPGCLHWQTQLMPSQHQKGLRCWGPGSSSGWVLAWLA